MIDLSQSTGTLKKLMWPGGDIATDEDMAPWKRAMKQSLGSHPVMALHLPLMVSNMQASIRRCVFRVHKDPLAVQRPNPILGIYSVLVHKVQLNLIPS